ncbi:MAG: hypothetical protein MJK15_04455 [Colwellia sp.]|nr:hypothetical protein [Colwellia sp.]
MKTYLITMLLLTQTLLGCGGEEESEGKVEVAQETPPPVNTVTTSELVSTPEFNFISGIKLTVTLPASPTATIDYFINICTDFINEDNVISINYQSCKLRTAITAQTQEFTLSLSVAELQLVAQIWPIESNAQAINAYWDIAESGRNWKIAF